MGIGGIPLYEFKKEDIVSIQSLYDGNYLNKAAILLFGKNPNKWIVGSSTFAIVSVIASL